MRKTDRAKVEDRKIKRQTRIGYEKTKIKETHVSFREQITTKEERKKRRNCGLHSISVLGRCLEEIQVNDRKD